MHGGTGRRARAGGRRVAEARPGRGCLARAGAALALLAGCSAAPTVAPVAHDALPDTWRGRSAYATTHAIVLARDEGDARQGAGLSAEVAAAFRERTGRRASARVLLVMGCRDVTDELSGRVEARLRGHAALDGRGMPSPGQVDRALAELHEKGKETGVPPDLLLALEPDVVRAGDLAHFLSLPPAAGDAFDWCLVLPTSAELEDAIERSTGAALESQDLSFGERLLAAPLLPFVRSAMQDAVGAIARGRLYAAHAVQQADWTEARRRSEIEAYVSEAAGAVEARLEAHPFGADAAPDAAR